MSPELRQAFSEFDTACSNLETQRHLALNALNAQYNLAYLAMIQKRDSLMLLIESELVP